MYAILQTGGKQYRVAEGDTIDVARLPDEVGANVEFDQVLLVSSNDAVQVGTPTVDKARVLATVQTHGRGKKIIVFKHRKNYRRKQGHRQDFTRLHIEKIVTG
ncbi:MAG: 50S ribosomal protein L21 [Anaerolineae bacterium]